jgi:branched-chain amino acid transport system substrate-binding protein
VNKRDRDPSEDGSVSEDKRPSEERVETSRREFIRLAGLGGAALIGGPLLAACADGTGSTTTAAAASTTAAGTASGRPLKIGYVTPQTGALASFGEADSFVLGALQSRLAEGVSVGGVQHSVELIVRDTQSDPVVAGEVAGELILDDSVDLMLVASTPETTNPVSDQCEINGVPCVSTVAPWQAWLIPRGGDPTGGSSFMWTYHYFWGLETMIPQFIALWDQLGTNKIVGGVFPNDGDGNVWGEQFPAPLEAAGYTLVDPGRYENLSDDFSTQIAAFNDAGCQIITGVPLPPDFTTFWTQAQQQGLTPVGATIGKAILFPASVDALDGDSGDGLTSEVWWSPSHPFSSSLTGQSAAELADAYTAETGAQWTQPLGFAHSLVEVAVDVFSRTEDVDDRESVLAAVMGTGLDTIVGPVGWSGGGPTNPVPNVSTTPMTGGQWVLGGDFKYELLIVDNSLSPDIPTGGTIKPIPGS